MTTITELKHLVKLCIGKGLMKYGSMNGMNYNQLCNYRMELGMDIAQATRTTTLKEVLSWVNRKRGLVTLCGLEVWLEEEIKSEVLKNG